MKCDDQILIELLKNTETRLEDEATLHISTCRQCQRRIEQLAAHQDSWQEISVALNTIGPSSEYSGSVVIAVDTELAGDMPLQADHVSLEFLDPPSHPEMLGRIGRYEIERLVGAGGMGIVLKAFDTELHRPVAVKVLAPHLAHSGAARQRFAREAQSAAAVVHENVVPIHNVDTDGKLPFLVMQYVAGESLQGRVDRSGSLGTQETLRIGCQIANGLAAAHEQGLVHRDVKPGNVLLEESVDRVLISDFGLARAADDASVTRSGVIAGTPHYMSPEQARGDFIDARSDLFGLGSVLYFMCVGHPPFRATGAMGVLHRICNDQHRPVDEINPTVPAPLADLIDELLSKSPDQRPPTSADVATRLNSQLLDSRSQKRFRRNQAPIAKRLAKHRRLLLATGALLCLLASCFAISKAWPPGRVAQQTPPTLPHSQQPLRDSSSETTRTKADERQMQAASPPSFQAANAPGFSDLHDNGRAAPDSFADAPFGGPPRDNQLPEVSPQAWHPEGILQDHEFDALVSSAELEADAIEWQLLTHESNHTAPALSDDWHGQFEQLNVLINQAENELRQQDQNVVP